MKYIKVKWKHEHPDEPILLYSELDEDRWETRKVEVFRSGRCGFADDSISEGGSRLGLEPVPTVAEIASDPQFDPIEIASEEFEQVWAKRRGRFSTVNALESGPL